LKRSGQIGFSPFKSIKGDGVNMKFLILLAFFYLSLPLGRASENEVWIPAQKINDKFISAYLTNGNQWCSPATLIGPNVFLTSAHCLPLIGHSKKIQIVGLNNNQKVAIRNTYSHDSIISEDEFFSGEECKNTFESINDKSQLKPSELLKCWYSGGKSDVAIIVTEADFTAPMFSISSRKIDSGEQISFLRYADGCGGEVGNYSLAQLDVFGFQKNQMVLNGNHQNGSTVKNCGGSGGPYFSKKLDGSVEVIGLHSAGTRANLELTIYGKRVFLPANFLGGTHLRSQEVWQWLNQIAAEKNLKICGVNFPCQPVFLPIY
tara:strand:+ start:869 stop:1825 length:957 start_codon:yes stop_codon:yes gene_type:complete